MQCRNSGIEKMLLAFGMLALLLTLGCGGSGGGGASSSVVNNDISGFVQKGPYLNGSSVTIYELDANLNQTGKTFNTQITNNRGEFKLSPNVASRYAELKADGYYFNEVTGGNSTAPLTLYALVDLTDKSVININLLTHLERPRVKWLMAQGTTFTDAKRQAQREILQLFEINNDTIGASETLDLAESGEGNAILLAVSAILLGNRTEAELSELLANIISDFEDKGTLTNGASGSALVNGAMYIDMNVIRRNLEDRYNALGVPATIPDGGDYAANFIEKTTYLLTEFITYPATGTYGLNVLAENFVSYQKWDNYSLSAVVPKGCSLKIRISGEYDGSWAFAPFELNGWQYDEYDSSTHSRIFTSNATGFLNLKLLLTGGNVSFEVYENGAETASWTKTVTETDISSIYTSSSTTSTTTIMPASTSTSMTTTTVLSSSIFTTTPTTSITSTTAPTTIPPQ